MIKQEELTGAVSGMPLPLAKLVYRRYEEHYIRSSIKQSNNDIIKQLKVRGVRGFTWSATPEGWEFWNNIDNKPYNVEACLKALFSQLIEIFKCY